MHAGRNFSVPEVLFWTWRDIVALLIVATIPTFFYEVLDWKWLAIPWLPIALLGTAVAFVVGFKNNASYERVWEARKAWGGIINSSRSWGIMVKDYITNRHAITPLSDEEIKKLQLKFIHRHFAWLAAMRYQLRETRVWEAIVKKHNAEYKKKYFRVEEQEEKMEDALLQYLPAEEVKLIMSKTNKAAYIISLQSAGLKELVHRGYIEDYRHMELEKMLVEFYNQQGVCERIKNFPYPRQYATVNLYFVKMFVLLIPLGMLKEFAALGDNLVWLSIPFSALSAWIFTTMEKIGEASENPFEGSANDIPITAMSRSIEIDLKQMFGEENVPEALVPNKNKILL